LAWRVSLEIGFGRLTRESRAATVARVALAANRRRAFRSGGFRSWGHIVRNCAAADASIAQARLEANTAIDPPLTIGPVAVFSGGKRLPGRRRLQAAREICRVLAVHPVQYAVHGSPGSPDQVCARRGKFASRAAPEFRHREFRHREFRHRRDHAQAKASRSRRFLPRLVAPDTVAAQAMVARTGWSQRGA